MLSTSFAAAAIVTAPEPVPPAPDVTVSHAAVLVVAQVHVAADAVTVTCWLAAAAWNVNDVGETEKVQGGGSGAPACVTCTVRPATVNVADRAVVAVFADTVKRTSLVPVPPGALLVIQAALDRADHAQDGADAVTVTTAVVAGASRVSVAGATVSVHGGGSFGGGGGAGSVGAATCAIVSTRPAIVSEPTRADELVLGLTRKRTSAVPVPVAGPLIVTHPTVLAALQGQLGGAMTPTPPSPPSAPTGCVPALSS